MSTIKNKHFDICIEARNIAGLGSINVVSNILRELSQNNFFCTNSVYLTLPNIEFWNNFSKTLNINWTIRLLDRKRNKYHRLINRAFDIIFGHLTMPRCKILIVLGDFPLRTNNKQVLLLHNAHLINETKSNYSFSFHRLIFSLNHKYVDFCIVQTSEVKNRLEKIYPHFISKTESIFMPVRSNLNKHTSSINKLTDFNVKKKFKLFYPASFYLHKNHKILVDLLDFNKDILENFYLKLTITKDEFSSIKKFKSLPSNLEFVGLINESEILSNYFESDALFFPSIDESYGLPLVEAMKLGLYIICSDMPYAKTLCGDQAIYFDPYDVTSLIKALDTLSLNITNNIKPDWSKNLVKIPENWEIYTNQFLEKIFI